MSLTNTAVVTPFVPGQKRCTVTKVVFDSSYPTGGEALTPTDLGLNTVVFAEAQVQVAGTGSVTAVFYDITNQKLKAFTAAAEVANTTDLSAVTAQVVAFGH
jgi:hypothetical protein